MSDNINANVIFYFIFRVQFSADFVTQRRKYNSQGQKQTATINEEKTES